jgi:hypothetical protein
MTPLERAGRLTSGFAPLHVRRKGISDTLKDNIHMIKTMMEKWPTEYQFEPDHNIHELLQVMEVVADDLVTPVGPTK